MITNTFDSAGSDAFTGVYMQPARWHAHMAAAIAALLIEKLSGMSNVKKKETWTDLGMLTAMQVSCEISPSDAILTANL